ncbi:MAG: hypothetical protein A2017_12320 [Lentisphaerae bacterium GWF2_44_16]|nr:MAG: hypothetical protein A2017_12320 [Lentisphaerae bacterium GWF2_44_16]
MEKYNVVKSEKFRAPLNAEKKIGLWVDRIGSGSNRKSREMELRILGLYAAVYIERGEGFFFSAKTGHVKARGGDTMFLFPDIPAFYNPDETWNTKWIVWDGPDAANLEKMGFFKSSNPVIKSNINAVPSAYERLSEIIDNEDMASIFERKNIILNMLFELYRASKRDENPARNSLMEKAISYMNNSLEKDASINEFAAHCGLSETHFRRLFKNYTGRSPKDFMNSLKISKAKAYLSQGRSIKQTAELLGFEDIFYFMRLFKKISGTAPGKFQQMK